MEGTSRTDEERLRGRTRHNKAVNFTGLAEPGRWRWWRSTPPRARPSPAPSGRSLARWAGVPVIAVFGPTGVGKTALALELADRLRDRGGTRWPYRPMRSRSTGASRR